MAATATASKQASQGPSKAPESAGAKVTVYCKMPHGLRLRAFKMIRQSEPVMGGGRREFEIAEEIPGSVVVHGNRFRVGEPSTHRITNGYGVTPGVDKDLWDSWLRDNEDSPMVLNKLIFAYEDKADGIAATREFRDIKSGLEPMEKEKDPRAPQPLTPGIGRIEEAVVDD